MTYKERNGFSKTFVAMRLEKVAMLARIIRSGFDDGADFSMNNIKTILS